MKLSNTLNSLMELSSTFMYLIFNNQTDKIDNMMKNITRTHVFELLDLIENIWMSELTENGKNTNPLPYYDLLRRLDDYGPCSLKMIFKYTKKNRIKILDNLNLLLLNNKNRKIDKILKSMTIEKIFELFEFIGYFRLDKLIENGKDSNPLSYYDLSHYLENYCLKNDLTDLLKRVGVKVF